MGAFDNAIKILQARIDVSYEEAERTIIKCNGDLDKAYYRILNKRRSVSKKVLNYVWKILNYSFIVKRKDNVLIDLPFFIFFILLPVMGPLLSRLGDFAFVFIFLTGIIVFSGCDVVFKNPDTTDFSFKKKKIHGIIDVKNQEEIIEEDVIPEDIKLIENEDGYNEISIE